MGAAADPVLVGYVEVWWRAVADLTALLDEVPAEQWHAATDLPGWDVRAVASHTAHLESVLAHEAEEHAEVGRPAHAVSPMGLYTEIGVVNRRGTAPAEVVAEIRAASTARHERLLVDPPSDGDAPPPYVFGGIGWSTATLLRNRPLDVWMHEQDVRRAIGRLGGLDSPAAAHVVDYLCEGFGYVLAKKVRAAPGTTAVLDVAGSAPVAFEVDGDGRGVRLADPPPVPTVGLAMDRASYVVLAGGRRAPEPGSVTVTGDQALGAVVLQQLATTP